MRELRQRDSQLDDFLRPGFLRFVVRKNARFFLWMTVVALTLRLMCVFFFPGVVDDSRLYANIAENWLQHGAYAITNSGAIMPTLSRLPGYPAFLAAIFTLFGVENFRAALLVQVSFDLGTCFLIAAMAWRLFSSERAAKAAFILTAVCPFLVNYAATALTETLEIFFTVLALYLALRGLTLSNINNASSHSRVLWLGCGFAIGAAILLRPDGGILLAAIGGYLLWLLLRRTKDVSTGAVLTSRRAILHDGIFLAAGVLVCMIPWTLRNLHTFHHFEPLAPRYANDADEPATAGFNRWVKTWMQDYVSVEEIYWKVPGDTLDATLLPDRAFDSAQQKQQTIALFADYNRDHDLTPEQDVRFAALAADRIHAAPLRYYIWLPAARIADMWLRPRTELLPSDPRWWEFNDDRRWLAVSLALGVVNLFYVVMAGAGLLRGDRFFGIGLFVLFLVLRSVFLGTLENPEPRYTLECYPAVIMLAAGYFIRVHKLPNLE